MDPELPRISRTENKLSEKGVRRRKQILRAARRSFDKNGYVGLRMRQVATECGIDLKNLQYYFRTKEDLFLAICQEEYDKTIAALKKVSLATNNISQKVSELEDVTWLTWDDRTTAIWLQLYSMAVHSTKARKMKIEIYQAFYTELASLLKTLYPAAGNDALYTTARIFTTMVDGITLGRIPGKSDPLDFASLQEEIKRISPLIFRYQLS